MTMRPSDVPTYVEAGAADLGITGKDVLDEQAERAVYELLDLGYGRCRMVLAARRGDGALEEAERRLGAMRIATKYPRTAERHFERTGRQAEVIEVKGSVELAPLVGLADGIVDLVDIGPDAGRERARGARGDRGLHRAPGRQPGRPQAARRGDRRAGRAPAGGGGMRLEPIEWDGTETDELAAGVRALVPSTEDAAPVAAEIVARVARLGDTALRELAIGFGETPPERLRVDPERIRSAAGARLADLRDSLRTAAANVYAVARAELERLERPAMAELPQGQRVEVVSAPVASAGVYAPADAASIRPRC